MDFTIQTFAQMFLRITRGNYRGTIINAKPIYLISLIDVVRFKEENKFLLSDKLHQAMYLVHLEEYAPNCHTAFLSPYYHLDSEPFYELVWNGSERPLTKSQTPSARYLEEHLAYAKLDDELWLLLQDAENRGYFKQLIIDYYLKDNQPLGYGNQV